MSKELDAFYDLKNVYWDNDIVKEKYGITPEISKLKFDIIETALKKLEEIDDTLSSKLKFMNDLLFTLEETCKKQDEILGIIKECFNLNGFGELIPNSKYFKSEEKQNLLEEYFTNGND